GSDFWPLQNEIIPVASENLYGMKYLTWVGGAFADFLNYKIQGNGYVQKNDTLNLQVTLKNRGLSMTSKNVTVNISSNFPGITALNSAVNYDSIGARQFKDNVSNPFRFIIPSTAVYMDEMKFIVSVKQEGIQTSLDTIRINVGKTNILFSDNAENGISRWTRAGTGILWDTTFIDPIEASKNFSDSRFGNSKNSSNNTFTLIDTIDLTGTNNPRIEFTAKWAEEVTFDYTRIQVSTNFGSTWTNIAGRYTTLISGQPSYTAIKHWVFEQINLNAYIGQKIRIRFNLVTDAGVPGDGFYFDNFRVVNYKDVGTGIVQTGTSLPSQYKLYQNYPNPFNPVTKINYDIPVEKNFNASVLIKVYDILGNEISTLVNEKQNAGSYSVDFDGSNYPSGVYYYNITLGSFTDTKKMILLK
ncbi:MAG TPA: immune inhibitor A, partial [Ignavibacteria bacterium]|nr:immune inhibitor A [Ignavibacteria bacterium]